MNETINTNETINKSETTIETSETTQMPQMPPQPPIFGQPPMIQFGGMSFGGQMPIFDQTQQISTDASQIPTFDGTQQQFGGQMQFGQPPMMQFGGQQFGQGFMQAPPDMNMWGNGEFAGEQIFNGENFVAPDDIGSITDASTDISVNFGEQSGFGFGFGFPPAGMPPVMNCGQITEQNASTETQAE